MTATDLTMLGAWAALVLGVSLRAWWLDRRQRPERDFLRSGIRWLRARSPEPADSDVIDLDAYRVSRRAS